MKKLVVLAVSCLLMAAGCRTASTAHLTVSHQWARTSPMDATTGVVYFTITSPAADTLTGASVDATVAGAAQLHQTVMNNGSMTMQEVTSVPLAAGTSVAFAPGGYHLMLMPLAAALKAGTHFDLTLQFAKAGTVKVSVPVLDQAP